MTKMTRRDAKAAAKRSRAGNHPAPARSHVGRRLPQRGSRYKPGVTPACWCPALTGAVAKVIANLSCSQLRELPACKNWKMGCQGSDCTVMFG
jgi:hypothetical protein